MKKPFLPPRLVLFAAAFFVSTSAILIKGSTAPSLLIAAYRLLFAVAIMLPYVLAKHRDEIKSLDKKIILRMVLAGFFLACHFAFWNYCLVFTNVASATVLVDLHIVITAVIGYLVFKNRLPKFGGILIFLMLMGAVMISAGDSAAGSNMLLGDALALCAATGMSIYMLLGSGIRKSVSSNVYTTFAYSSASLFLFGAAVLGGIPLTGFAPREWLIFLGLALFPTLLGHSINAWSLGYLSPVTVSSILAIPIFREIPSITQLGGGLLILVCILLYLRMDARREKELETE